MCIIIAKPKGMKAIPLKNIYQGCENNPDSFWIYASNGDKTTVVKYNDYRTMLDAIHKYNNPEWLLVIHARIATHWAIDFINQHPYPLTNDIKQVVNWQKWKWKWFMHNGILSEFGADKRYSDSIDFGVQFLSKTENKDVVEKKIWPWNKIVVMDGAELTIYNEGAGVYDNGVWYSNNSYKQTPFNNLYSDYGYNTDMEFVDYEIWEYLDDNFWMEILSYDNEYIRTVIKTSSWIKTKWLTDKKIDEVIENYISNLYQYTPNKLYK